MADLLAERTRLRVFVAEDPLTAILRGTAKAMLDRKTYRDVFIA